MGAPLGAPTAAGMTRACHAHYAGAFCDAVVRQHGARPGVGWGRTPAHARLRWARLGCPTPTLTLTLTPALTLAPTLTLVPTLILTPTLIKARLGCDKHSVAEDYAFFHPAGYHPEEVGAPATTPATAPAIDAAAEAAVAAAPPPPPPRRVDAGLVHCVAPTNGALLPLAPPSP